MFTKNEINALLNYPNVFEKVATLKQQFIDEEAEFLKIGEHDFLSLILLTPFVGIALANGSVSLFEEMILNKKARKMSKGNYWLKTDPVIFAMEHLITDYKKWSPIFYAFIKKLIQKTVDLSALNDNFFKIEELNESQQCIKILKSPFIIVRFLTSFFMGHEEEDFLTEHRISKNEYKQMTKIAKKLGFNNLPIYQIYRSKLVIRGN